MTKTRKSVVKSSERFGETLGLQQLTALAAELQALRTSPPIVTKTPGHHEGDILGFVKGLRLSAKMAYFLGEKLSHLDYEISWGHLLDSNLASCSPECDIVIHSRGCHRQWNGGNDHPIMDFRFILAASAKVVISCKSVITSVDKTYPALLKKYGVKHVFLVAECCDAKKYESLSKSAKAAGYAGLLCLYFTMPKSAGFKCDETLYLRFVESILATLPK